MSDPFFFYGTLRDPVLRATVCGGSGGTAVPALCRDRVALTVIGQSFPVLLPAPGAVTGGVLVTGLDAAAAARLALYESGQFYVLEAVPVETAEGAVTARAWVSDGTAPVDGQVWDHAAWEATARDLHREAAAEFMALAGTDPDRLPKLWPGIMARATARVRAAAEVPVRRLRGTHDRSAVEQVRLARPYANFFAVEEHTVRFRRHDGGLSAPVLRAAFVSGDAVTVLPWDPVTDRVLLIEQWRAGPWARGDRAPWCVETVAGRIDAGESPETTARREAEEEAGVTLGRLAHVATYYPSPGAVAEQLVSYVGEADLGRAGGVFGLASEEEDIRAFTLPRAEAMAAIGTGEIGNGPLILTLYWLAREAERLRRDWTGG